MATWDPGMDLVRSGSLVKASATDAQERPRGCGVFAALKARPGTKPRHWRRRYNDQGIPLDVIRKIATSLHGDPRLETWEGLKAAVLERLDTWRVHPGVRVYAEHAVEQYLDAHEELVAQVGELRFVGLDPFTSNANRELHAWAPLYAGSGGLREIRRLRIGSARRQDPDSARWTAVAAQVAATVPMEEPARLVRVVEVGVGDGSIEVVFEGTPEEVRARYEELARPAIQVFVQSTDMTPGHGSCKDCKVAGCCPSLMGLDGCLGQEEVGTHTRSVSASDLELYGECPARWYLERECNLPRQAQTSAAAERGKAVHRWLAQAHARGRQCTSEDVGLYSAPGTYIGTLTQDDYVSARPFLEAHLTTCPLDGEARVVLAIEKAVYGYDASADVVIASQPDLVYTDAEGTVVVRETKTAKELPADAGEAFDRFFPVPWLINIVGTRADAFGGLPGSPRVELEVIAETAAAVFAWTVEETGVVRMARSEVAHRAGDWNHDRVWGARPGRQCARCPVRKWCPDAADGDEDAEVPLGISDEPCAGLPSAATD